MTDITTATRRNRIEKSADITGCQEIPCAVLQRPYSAKPSPSPSPSPSTLTSTCTF